MTAGVYVLSCGLASGPLWLGIYPFLWWFLLAIFVLFLLHWRYELPCQDKLPEFQRTLFVFHPLGLRLDKTLCGWNSVIYACQDNAWMDERVMLMWVEMVLKPYVDTAPDNVFPLLFLDSYHCHMMNSAVNVIQDLGVEVKLTEKHP